MRALAIAAAAASVLSWAAPAQAQVPGEGEVLAACLEDAGRLCFGVLPGGGRVLKCIIAHQKQASPGCQGALREEAEKRQAAAAKAAAAKAAKAGAANSTAAPNSAGTTSPAPPAGAAKQ